MRPSTPIFLLVALLATLFTPLAGAHKFQVRFIGFSDPHCYDKGPCNNKVLDEGECKNIKPFQSFCYIYKQDNARQKPDGKTSFHVTVYFGEDCTGRPWSPMEDASVSLGQCYRLTKWHGRSFSVHCWIVLRNAKRSEASVHPATTRISMSWGGFSYSHGAAD
jgi:hypothetical protein